VPESATLVCCAAAIGYGPATKLVLLADALRAQGLRPVFLGSGSALEAARRSPAFVDVVDAAPDTPAARKLIAGSAGVLSSMEREHLRTAQAFGRPTFVVDSLLWMRDHVPTPFRQATRYWAQDFVGVRERAQGVAEVVGPLLPPAPAVRAPVSRLVVALGGAPSPFADAADDDAWGDVLAGGLRAIAGQFADVVCLASERMAERLDARHGGRGIAFASAAPADAASLLASASLVLAAPGLTTTLECFQLGVPTVFLPPFSYSQWWILKVLRARRLAPQAYHWADRTRTGMVTHGMSEDGRGDVVRAVMRAQLPRMTPAFVEGLSAMVALDRDALAARQRRFVARFGESGVPTIAGAIASRCAVGSAA
jgi:hypothetical protein